jgi:ribosome-associated protein
MTFVPRVLETGALQIRPRLVIPGEEIDIRFTTSGGPGGQHANRSLTRVIASFHVTRSEVLNDADRALLLENMGSVVRSSSGRFRSQGQNRSAALEQLANKIGAALTPPNPRRASKPTKASKVRRIEDKKARGRVKENRRRPTDD